MQVVVRAQVMLRYSGVQCVMRQVAGDVVTELTLRTRTELIVANDSRGRGETRTPLLQAINHRQLPNRS